MLGKIFFNKKNDFFAPINCDFIDNDAISDINRRIDVGNKLLGNWEISFY